MVKGISKQVIVVHSPDEKLFEQAIFILNERAMGREGVSDDVLLREARKLMSTKKSNRDGLVGYAALWAFLGALVIGSIWLISALF